MVGEGASQLPSHWNKTLIMIIQVCSLDSDLVLLNLYFPYPLIKEKKLQTYLPERDTDMKFSNLG